MSHQPHRTRTLRALLYSTALGAVLVARTAGAQPGDDYPDDPPAPPPKAQPKPPVAKPPVAKPPAPKPPAPKPPAAKPLPADEPAPPPKASAVVPPRPAVLPPGHQGRKPTKEGIRRLGNRPGAKKPGAHGKPGQHGKPGKHGKHGKHGKTDPHKKGGAHKKKYPKDEHGNCIGHGLTDRPTEINLLHGWLGVNNEKAIPAPRRTGTFDWGWWKWQLTPYLWRYENHHDHCDPRNQPIPLLANIINLGALLFLFARFGRKPVAEALRKRKKTIMSDLDKARSIKRSAKERLAHFEEELSNLDERLVALKEKYVAEGKLEEKRVIAAGESARKRMLADADFRLTQESKSARDDLSREALNGALTAAEKLLTSKITKADHDRLAEEYLAQIGPALENKQTRQGTGGAA